jgi:hypothetical protein
MASVNRDIAKILGRTEAVNTDNVALGSGSGLTVYATPNLLPTSGFAAGDQAFVTSNNRIYISNGSGWYNVALINSTPTFTSGPAGSYALATDLTPTVITLVAQDSDGQAVTYSGTPSGMDGIATLSQDSSVFTVTPLTDSAGGNIGSFTITFQATDGIGIASALSTFTLSFGPDWSATPTESILRASDAQADDWFAWQVAISADGNYAIVGARYEDTGGSNAGAAYIFTRSGSTWSQQQKITASDAQADDYFGYSVSINSDATYAIVGAYGEDTGGTDAGAAYIFTRSGSTWTQQQKIVSSDIQEGDYFGFSVSINSDATYAICGAEYEDTGGSNAGAAYVFTRSGSTWTQQAKITASDAQASDFFGYSVSINSDATYAIVGARQEDGGAGDPLTDAGAAYVFTRSGSTWTQQAKLVSSDAQASDYFGLNVSINSDGTYAIVAAYGEGDPLYRSGAAYIFTRSGSSWSQQQKIVSSDLQASDYFGYDVSINSDATIAIVSALFEDGGSGDPFSNAGAAYIFTRSGSTWTEVKKLTASDAQASDLFGQSVSISSDGSYAIVGARGEDGGAGDPLSAAGAAYIYEAG